MADEYKRPMYYRIADDSILSTTDNTRSPQRFASRTDKSGESQADKQLSPKMRRSPTTETIMHPIGQNNLLFYPHFETAFLQTPQFLNSEDSKDVRRRDNF